ncbi:MAG TPA: TAXI family TRAP transporter solute-binding subunit [Nitrospiraceae bacterium]|nr:TAXI family TRAP transporter solute-binding subunit [Nitrospiraceae bacterium]
MVHRHPIFHALVPTNKSLALIVLILIPSLALSLYLVGQTHTKYYLLTGPHVSTASLVGPQFAEVLNKTTRLERWFLVDLIREFSAVESCGSLDNIANLNQGRAQLAFVEDGLPLHMNAPPTCLLPLNQQQDREAVKSDEVRLRAVMPLYLAPLHVISNRNLNYADVHDIKPRSKVYIGPDGSGTSFVSQLVLKHEGILIDRKGANWDFQKAMQEVLTGQIDVAFFMIALNSQEIKQLLDSPALHLLTVDSAQALTLLAPYLEIIKIPPSTYKVSAKEITTIGAKTILAASTDLSDSEVFEIATKLSHHMHDLLKDIPLNVSKVTDGSVDLYYPLHHGAIRFYNHDPPFFLDPHVLAGLGSYLSIVYASYALGGQWLRHYRLHRLLQLIDRIIRISKRAGHKPEAGYTDRYFHAIRIRMARLLREGRIKMDDIGVINEYIKSHS